MPQHTIKHPLTFSLFVGVLSTIAIFCTLAFLYLTLNESKEMEFDPLILWIGILPISLVLSILLGKHSYRKTAPEYINTEFKGKMAIVYSVLIAILIAAGMFIAGCFIVSLFNGFAGKSVQVIAAALILYGAICSIVGVYSGIFSYKKVKASVVEEMTAEE